MIHGETVLPAALVAAASDEYRLLQLASEAGTGDGVVRHFICFDCLELVEKTMGVEHVHNCPAEHEGVRSLE